MNKHIFAYRIKTSLLKGEEINIHSKNIFKDITEIQRAIDTRIFNPYYFYWTAFPEFALWVEDTYLCKDGNEEFEGIGVVFNKDDLVELERAILDGVFPEKEVPKLREFIEKTLIGIKQGFSVYISTVQP